jgi:NAD+ synthase
MKKIKLPEMNPEKVANQIGDFIIEQIVSIGYTGAVIGLSGGVDSTVTAALAKRAFDIYNLKNEKKLELIGYMLPSKTNLIEDTADGKKFADRLKIKYQIIDIQPVVEAYKNTNPETFETNYNKGNLMSEIRATILHQKAATEKKLVLGTGNKDEDFCVGYYTLFGDGAVHLSPIEPLSKRLVKQMAVYLGFEDLSQRIPSAGLEPGQTDFKDLGYKYETAEIIMEGFAQGLTESEILKEECFIKNAKDDLKEYYEKYKIKKFEEPSQIINDVVRRNKIAIAKSKIVHPPTPTIKFEEELKIALFGGSFNPVHNGHLQIAEELISEGMDEVWFIPCGNHAFGKELIEGEKRVDMIKLTINEKMKVLDLEIKSDKKSFSAETIKYLMNKFPNLDFYYIIGADNLDDLDKWHDFQFLKSINFIVIKRPGFEIKNKHGIKIVQTLNIENHISSKLIRKNIREDLSIETLIPSQVVDYIKKENLY